MVKPHPLSLCGEWGSLGDSQSCPPPSATRLPPSWRGPWALRPRLAAGLPLSRCRSAIALVKTIVLTWSPPAYMPDGHLSRGRLASFLYTRRLFLRMNFVESVRARFAAYIGQEQTLSSLWLWFGRQPWRSGGLELRSSPQRNLHLGYFIFFTVLVAWFGAGVVG